MKNSSPPPGRIERFDRRLLVDTFAAERDVAERFTGRARVRGLRAVTRARAGRFEHRLGARREAARVQLRTGRQVEVDARQRRRRAFVFGAPDQVFRFQRSTGAEFQPRVREVRNRNRLRPEADARRGVCGRARRREREREYGSTTGCSAHRFFSSLRNGRRRPASLPGPVSRGPFSYLFEHAVGRRVACLPRGAL